MERGDGIDRAPPHTPRPERLRHEVQYAAATAVFYLLLEVTIGCVC